MVLTDENNPVLATRKNYQGGDGKKMAAHHVNNNRASLRVINTNIEDPPLYRPALLQKSSIGPTDDGVLDKKPLFPVNRPITRRYSSQLYSKTHSAKEDSINVSNKSMLTPSEPQVCIQRDVDDYMVDDNMPLPSFVHLTEAMLKEIDEMVTSNCQAALELSCLLVTTYPRLQPSGP